MPKILDAFTVEKHASSPVINFIGDLDTGIGSFANDSFSMVVNGAEKARWNTGGLKVGDTLSVSNNYGDNPQTDVVGTPPLHVTNFGTSGKWNAVAYFQGGGDADITGAAIKIGHFNDRGLQIRAGRHYSDVAIVYFDLIRSNGDKFNFFSATQSGSYANIEIDGSQIDLNYQGSQKFRVESTQNTSYANIIPGGDISYDLGSLNTRWAQVHVNEIYLGNDNTSAYHRSKIIPNTAQLGSFNGGVIFEPYTTPGSGTSQHLTWFRTASGTGSTQHNVSVDGRLGIGLGNTVPTYDFHINSSQDAKIVLSGSTNPYIRFQESSTNRAYIQWNASNDALQIVNQQGSYLDLIGASTVSGIRIRTSDNAIRSYVYATNAANFGFLDSGGSWAIRHSEDQGTYFYDTSTVRAVIGADLVESTYGTIEVKDNSGKGGYDGYTIIDGSTHGQSYMSNGTWTGLYDGANNIFRFRYDVADTEIRSTDLDFQDLSGVTKLRLVTDNDTTDQDVPWIRTSNYIVINPVNNGHVYLNWDSSGGGSGHTYTRNSFYAKSFVDSENTSFLVDPSSISKLHSLQFTDFNSTFELKREIATNLFDERINLWPSGGAQLLQNIEFYSDMSGFSTYDNAGTGAVSRTLVADATAPNSSGNLMRITYTSGIGTPSPGYGGFHVAITETSYERGDIIFWRILANIPVGRTLAWASNAYGTENYLQSLTDMNGVGDWKEYIYVQKIGQTGTFSSTGFFYITGGSNSTFSWDVARVTAETPFRPEGIFRNTDRLYWKTFDKRFVFANSGGGGISGYVPYYDSADTFANSAIFFDGTSKIGILDASPSYTLDVNGTTRVVGLGGTIARANVSNASLIIGDTTTGIGIDPNEIASVGGAILLGTTGNHAIEFFTNTTTRIYISELGHFYPNTNATLNIGTSSNRWQIIYGAFLSANNGSASNPSIRFTDDSDTGFYSYTANQVGVACAGNYAARFGATFLQLNGNNIIDTDQTVGSITHGLRIDAGEGFAIYGNTHFFGSNNDAVIFQMEDVNKAGGQTDGGFVFRGFSPTGTTPVADNWMVIKSPGLVGINTTDPSYELDVSGDSRVTGKLGVGIAPSDKFQVLISTNNEIGFHTAETSVITDVAIHGPAIKFSRPSDGINNLAGIFTYNATGGETNLAIASREDIVFACNSGSTYGNAQEKIRLHAEGHWVPYNDGDQNLGASGNRWQNTYTERLFLDLGSAASPSLTFTSDTNTGLYNTGSDGIGVSIAGVLEWEYTASGLHSRDINSFITFYSDTSLSHAIGSRDIAGNIADDIRINSYGSVIINLDSNDNNTSGADFIIGKHGSGTGSSSEIFRIDGEDGSILMKDGAHIEYPYDNHVHFTDSFTANGSQARKALLLQASYNTHHWNQSGNFIIEVFGTYYNNDCYQKWLLTTDYLQTSASGTTNGDTTTASAQDYVLRLLEARGAYSHLVKLVMGQPADSGIDVTGYDVFIAQVYVYADASVNVRAKITANAARNFIEIGEVFTDDNQYKVYRSPNYTNVSTFYNTLDSVQEGIYAPVLYGADEAFNKSYSSSLSSLRNYYIAPASSGTALNINGKAITKNIEPTADSTYDLGTNSLRWANLYVDNIIATNGVTMGGFTDTRVIFAGISGALTEDSDFTYSSSNNVLTIGNADIGTWGASVNSYALFGHSALNHSQSGNYALLQESTGETFINATSGEVINFRIANSTKVATMSSTLFAINNDGIATLDFRISGDTATNLFYVDSSTDNVGINTASPSYPLDVHGAIRTTTNVLLGQYLFHDGDADTYLDFNAANSFRVVVGNQEAIRFNTSETVINEGSIDRDFRVEGDNNTHLIFADASTDRIGIRNSSPAYNLDVTGTFRNAGFRDLGIAKQFNEPTATAAGWYPIGHWGGSRGGHRIYISYTGGSWTPETYEIEVFKNWTTGIGIRTKQFTSVSYITDVRVVGNTGDATYYLEVYCPANANGHNMYIYHENIGYHDGGFELESSLAVSTNSGTVLAQQDFLSYATVDTNFGVESRIYHVSDTDNYIEFSADNILFSKQVDIFDTDAGPAYGYRFRVGRSAVEHLGVAVDGGNVYIKAVQDTDANAAHDFIIDRDFGGTGPNNFKISKGGGAQITVNTHGHVGLGEEYPECRLHLANQSSSTNNFATYPDYSILLYDTGDSATSYGFGIGTAGYLMANSGVQYRWFIDNTAYMTLTTTGLRIGDAGTPNATLQFSNSSGSSMNDYSDYKIILWDGGSGSSCYGLGIETSTMMFNVPGGARYRFYVGGTTQEMSLNATGLKIGTGDATVALDVTGEVIISSNLTVNGLIDENSSLRIKTDIKDFDVDLDKLSRIRPVRYIKKDTGRKEIGLIAEELDLLFPDLVGRDKHDRPDSVYYSRLTVLYGKAFSLVHEKQKKIDTRVEILEKEVEFLKEENRKLKEKING